MSVSPGVMISSPAGWESAMPHGGLSGVRTKTKPADVSGITHRDLMQPSVAEVIPRGAEWIFELKYDGFRCLAIRHSGRVRMLNRQGNDLATSFPEIVLQFRDLPGDVVIDGELVVLDDQGRPQFERLCGRARMSRGLTVMDASKREPTVLFAFDVLWCERSDQRNKTLLERKRTLAKLLRGTERIKPVSHIDVGEAAYDFAVKMGLEGVVAKKLGSYYQAGRTSNWLKIKTPVGRERESQRFDR